MENYDHKEIEPKWQDKWIKENTFETKEDQGKEKFYVLDMFPYPSGDGLHVGHPKGYIATDIISRAARMQGKAVLHPMGWDAFGLPAENYAIKNKIHPRKAVEKNIQRFKEQLSIIGLDYDWSREINTTDPEYYRWTQWIFLKLLEKGLAFESYEPINWCPSCQTGLANEDLEDGKCERCGSVVEKRPMRQWTLKITDYADRLLNDLELLSNWPAHIKESQRNWIGRSEGAEIEFKIQNLELQIEDTIKVFTTRADTLFGVTYVVLSPEHPIIQNLKLQIENWEEVQKYIEEAKTKTEIERTDAKKSKTGVELKGLKAINPANGEEVPVWVADYVLGNYGTGAVMAVPAHDERDYEFAKKYNLPLRAVVEPLVTKVAGVDAFEQNSPVVERNAVVAVIKHWSEDQYLGVEWGNTGWRGFVIGGMEGDESAAEAGLREITEETGYKNIEVVKEVPGTIHARFFQKIKNQNRLAHFHVVVFKLKDGQMTDVSEDEKKLHKLKWLSPRELDSFITNADMNVAWDRANDIQVYTGDGEEVAGCKKGGILINSGEFNSLQIKEGRDAITQKFGQKVVRYKLRDWVFSRQRYWGEPIPVIHCEKCGVVPVPYEDLPVKLPEVENYEPTGTGESPLANISEWVNVSCPKCGGQGKRETNTMPQWAGSSWYYLRYTDPKNNGALVSEKNEKYWMKNGGVDVYVGGAEHATRHLIYARFWHKFLYDLGVVSTLEPFKRLHSVGLVLAEDGRKMSKRYGNVVNPDDVVRLYGADSLRLYEMFMGPFENTIAWKTESLIGVRRFLEKVWRVSGKVATNDDEAKNIKNSPKTIETLLNITIKKVTEDIANFKFNTAISTMMIFLNVIERTLENEPVITKGDYEYFLQLLAPFAPHITEELWAKLGHTTSIHLEKWPEFDESKIVEEKLTIAVQVNGKVRATFEADPNTTEEEVKNIALGMPEVKKWIEGKEIKKCIFVKGKLLSIVLG